MHAGAAAQGSHYLLNDYSTAAEALRAMGPETLEETTQRQVRSAILRELSRCRSEDGSFVDNPLIGAAAGTGLAASTLLDLMAASPRHLVEETGPVTPQRQGQDVVNLNTTRYSERP